MSRSRTWFPSVALALVLFASSVIADDVVVLNDDNFDTEVGQDRGALVARVLRFLVQIIIQSVLSPLNYLFCSGENLAKSSQSLKISDDFYSAGKRKIK